MDAEKILMDCVAVNAAPLTNGTVDISIHIFVCLPSTVDCPSAKVWYTIRRSFVVSLLKGVTEVNTSFK